jgi:hypothetical protein
MAQVRLGPFSEVHFSLLTQKLDKAGVSYDRFDEPELLKSFIASSAQYEVHIHPQYSGRLPEYIYLLTDRRNLLLIKKDLDDLGHPPVSAEPQESYEEYFCLACDFSSREPGYCPRHNIHLVNYSDWVKNRKPSSSLRARFFYYSILAIFFLITIYGILELWRVLSLSES